MIVQDKMPSRLNILNISPGRGTQEKKTFESSSHWRKDYSNTNLAYKTGLSSQNQNKSIKLQPKTPAKDSVSTQLTFGGFLAPKKHLKIYSNIIEKSLQILQEVSPEQHRDCEKYISEFTNAVRNDEKFRKKLGFSNIQSKSMLGANSGSNLWAIPERSLADKTLRAIFAPVKAVYKWARNLIFDNNFGKKYFSSIYKNIQTEKAHDQLIANYANAVGLFNSIERWENLHRKRFGFDKIKGSESFMMTDSDLQRCLQKRSFDTMDPQKGQYSVKSLSVGNRIVSGVIGGVFYGIDAYNTTMRLSDDKAKSKKEGRIKFAQQMIRIGLASYFTATALGIFKTQTNKSMKAALLASSAMALSSEVLGRILVGNPVLPTNKRNLEEIKIKRQHSKNPILRFGNFLSGETRTAHNSPQPLTPIKLSNSYIEKRYQSKFFGAQKHNATTFQAIPKKYKKEDLSTILRLVENLDPNLAKYYKTNIVKNLIKKGVLKKEDTSKSFEQAISGLSEIEIGTTKTRGEKIKNALLAPVRWVKNIGKKIVGFFKKIFKAEAKTDIHKQNLQKIKDLELHDEYLSELTVFKKSAIFHNKSKFSTEQKTESFTNGFLHVKTTGFDDEIQGIQNSLEWLKKNARMNKTDNTDSVEAIKKLLEQKDDAKVKTHFQKLGDTMKKMSFVAYAKDFVDYDASKYTLANNILSGVLSAVFLVFDAYNLTMLHSNNKQKARESGAQYATQEATKTMMSSYVINGTNTIFQSFYNSSLLGAMTLATGSSLLLSGIARLATGSPLTIKTQKQLLEQEEKNKRNPMLKITSKMVGRSLKKVDFNKAEAAKTLA